ncbi:MAG: tetratricopeptide repeat protein [Candidatus Wallbacteria bacterium]|nr:tetratricopeptide repeat protein [Candidatus Wallbacteria bacterium]
MRSRPVRAAVVAALLCGTGAAFAAKPGPQAPEASRTASYWMELGRSRYLQGDWAGAVSSYRSAAAADAKSGQVRYLLGTALEAAGEHVEAEQAFRRALERDPADGPSHAALGILLAGRGHEAEAREHLDRAARLSPKDASIRYASGVLHLACGRHAPAAEAFGQALALNPRYDPAQLGLGRAWVAEGRRTEGERAVRHASARMSGEAVSDFDAVVLAWKPAPMVKKPSRREREKPARRAPFVANAGGRIETAVAAVALPACVSMPVPSALAESTAAGMNLRALAELAVGHPREALTLLTRCVDWDASSAVYVNNLASVQASLGFADTAAALFEIAAASGGNAGPVAARNLATLKSAAARPPAVRVAGPLAVLE